LTLQIANILFHKLYSEEGYKLFFHFIPSQQYYYFHSYYQQRKKEIVKKSNEQPKMFKDMDKSSLDGIVHYLESLSSFSFSSSPFSLSSEYGYLINDSFIEKTNSSSDSDFYYPFSGDSRVICHNQFPWLLSSSAVLVSTVVFSFLTASDLSVNFSLTPLSLSYLQSILWCCLPYIISISNIAPLEGLQAFFVSG
jgi:hypothetical protein